MNGRHRPASVVLASTVRCDDRSVEDHLSGVARLHPTALVTRDVGDALAPLGFYTELHTVGEGIGVLVAQLIALLVNPTINLALSSMCKVGDVAVNVGAARKAWSRRGCSSRVNAVAGWHCIGVSKIRLS